MIADIIIIAVLVCFVINSGAVDAIKRGLWRWLRGGTPYKEYSLKPFDCELCLTWWSGVAYIIVSGELSLWGLSSVGLVAWMTPVIVELLHLLRDFPRWGLDKLRNWLRL